MSKFLRKPTTVLAYEFQVVLLEEISFFSKLRILKRFGYVEKDLYVDIIKLNDIRNKVAHDMNFDSLIPPLNKIILAYQDVMSRLNKIEIKFEED